MPPRKQIVKDLGEDVKTLELLDDSNPVDNDSDNDEMIEMPKRRGAKPLPKPEPAYKPREKPAEKKPRTEAQIAAWNKALATRELKRNERKEKHESVKQEIQNIKQEKENKIQKEIEDTRKKLEDKIVQKAVSIKKKQIKKEMILDEISDDDEPIEEIKKKIQSRQRPPSANAHVAPPKPPKPTFIFL